MVLKNLLFFMATLLFIGWVLVVFVWSHPGQVKHILIVLAIITFVLGLTRKRTSDM